MQLEDRGRRSRDEEIIPERRRRSDINTIGKRLAVNTDKLDFDKYVYRWVNDTDARLYRLTKQDDWDIIQQDGSVLKDSNSDLGNAVSEPVGTKPDGSGMKAYLCRKLLRFHNEDQKMKQTELDEQLARMRRGNDAQGASQGDYVPNGGITIARS